jgi:hypothetical protein
MSTPNREENTMRDIDLLEGFANHDPLAEAVLDLHMGAAEKVTADEWLAAVAGTNVTAILDYRA